MGWFDKQVRQRKQNDQNVFEESICRMASVVLGSSGAKVSEEKRLISKAAIDEILKYYRFLPAEVPDSIKDTEEQLEYCLRPHGIMRRSIRLEEQWYRDAIGPILATRREDGRAVALLPKPFAGYWYSDLTMGTRITLDKQTAALLEPDAVCFYRPLPQRALGISDLLKYLNSCLNASDIAMAAGLTLLATLIGMLMPKVTRLLTGFVLDSGSLTLLLGTAVFIVCVTVSRLLIGAVNALTTNRLQLKTTLSVEAAVMPRMMSLPTPFFRRYSSGELSSRLDSVKQLCNLLVNNFFSACLTSLTSLLFLTQIFHYAPALVGPSIAIIIVTVGVSVAASIMQMKYNKQAMETSAKNNGVSYALITGVQKIKLAGAEKRAFARWANSYAEASELVYNRPLFLRVTGAINTAVSLAGTILLYYLAVKTSVSASEYIAFNAAYGAVMGAFTALSAVILSVANIKPILEMAEPILKTEPEIADNKEMVTRLSGSIELSNVCFRYSDATPWVVDGMNLKIRAGEYVAIVGPTGCGKSTLMRLLLGFETPEKGAIYYDGKDMSRLDLRSLRRRIGAVTQDGSLFQGDIYSNIVISAPELTLDEAWEAAEMAGIADDIRAMPMGMQTVIFEGQSGISGGQKQRLMIARAVAPKPKILIFDEATSALDNKTQKQVSEALDGLKSTRIIFAHRLSTIKNCDRILVLDKGKIIGDGTYDELIEHNALFAELVARQRLDTAAE